MDNFAFTSFLHLFARMCIITAMVVFFMALGERAIDYKLKKAVKAFVDAANLYIETRGAAGSMWPLILFTLGVPAVVAYVLG